VWRNHAWRSRKQQGSGPRTSMTGKAPGSAWPCSTCTWLSDTGPPRYSACCRKPPAPGRTRSARCAGAHEGITAQYGARLGTRHGLTPARIAPCPTPPKQPQIRCSSRATWATAALPRQGLFLSHVTRGSVQRQEAGTRGTPPGQQPGASQRMPGGLGRSPTSHLLLQADVAQPAAQRHIEHQAGAALLRVCAARRTRSARGQYRVRVIGLPYGTLSTRLALPLSGSAPPGARAQQGGRCFCRTAAPACPVSAERLAAPAFQSGFAAGGAACPRCAFAGRCRLAATAGETEGFSEGAPWSSMKTTEWSNAGPMSACRASSRQPRSGRAIGCAQPPGAPSGAGRWPASAPSSASCATSAARNARQSLAVAGLPRRAWRAARCREIESRVLDSGLVVPCPRGTHRGAGPSRAVLCGPLSCPAFAAQYARQGRLTLRPRCPDQRCLAEHSKQLRNREVGRPGSSGMPFVK